MIRRPPKSTRTDPLFPYTTLFRSAGAAIADPLIDRLVAPTAIRIAFERRAAQEPQSEETDFFGNLSSDGSIERSGFGTFKLVTKEGASRSEEHTSELQSLMRNSYAVFCLKKKKKRKTNTDSQ